MDTAFDQDTQPLQVTCTGVAQAEGDALLQYRIENTSGMTLHIFNSPRMPYILLQEDGSLLVLQGVHAPDPDLDYCMIEIPITRPIQAGEVATQQVNLVPLYLKNHYEEERLPTEFHGTVTVYCHVGWGETPILASERHKLSINSLLAWQHIAKAAAIEVRLP
jgi:hypothetical protein